MSVARATDNTKPPADIGSRFSRLSSLLEEAVADRVFPGCTVVVGRYGEVLFSRGFGCRWAAGELADSDLEIDNRMSLETVFDLASLTTVFVTTSLIQKLIQVGRLRLDDRVSRYIQGFGINGKGPITVGDLLSHSSGLPHWHPYFDELSKQNHRSKLGIMGSRGAKEYVYNSLNRAALKYKTGSKQLYSDLGYMVLGHLIEVLYSDTLDRIAYREIFQPLGLKSTSYVDLSQVRGKKLLPVTEMLAPTENCTWRKRVLCGEVHDDNAWAMGGIAGHGGLFSSAMDLHRLAVELIRAYHGESTLFSQELMKQFFSYRFGEEGGGIHYGWEGPGQQNGLAGSKLSEEAVGLNSFTGCSLWIEPRLGLDIILLSNRIHPSRSNRKIQQLRPVIIDEVLSVCES